MSVDDSQRTTNEPAAAEGKAKEGGADSARHYLNVAVKAAHAASDVLLAHRGKVTVEYKEGHGDLVTAADREAEETVIRILQGEFPDHAIIGEESGRFEGSDELQSRWFVDPLDGTTNFAEGLPLFATSIGFEQRGELLVGVIHLPVFDATYTAIRGEGAFLNGEPLRVSPTEKLQETLLVTGHAHSPGLEERVKETMDLLHNLISATRGVRLLGSAAVNLAYVAHGIFEAYWAPVNEVWDVAAGVLIVREAGGKVTDMKGDPIDLFRPNMLASNGHIHDALLEAFRKYGGAN